MTIFKYKGFNSYYGNSYETAYPVIHVITWTSEVSSMTVYRIQFVLLPGLE
jgi:hypothetical protein